MSTDYAVAESGGATGRGHDRLAPLLSPNDVAALTNLSVWTVRRAIRDGTLLGHKPRGRSRWLITREAYLEWVFGDERHEDLT